jgi:hypothetical protein
MKIWVKVLVVAALMASVGLLSCSSEQAEPQVRFTAYKIESEMEWLGRGAIVNLTLEVENEGQEDARVVVVYADLLNTDGTPRDITSAYIGSLPTGASYRETLTLDGEWRGRYRIKIEVKDATGSQDMMTSEEFILDPAIPWQMIFSLLTYLL